MTKPLHIQLLEILNNAGIGVTVNISSFMKNNFTKPLTEDATQWAIEAWPSKLFIDDLKGRSFISFSTEDPQLNKITLNNWYDTVNITIYITSYGLDYLDQYEYTQAQLELNKSYKNVNNASINNYKTQRNLAILTLGLALASAIYSWRAYNKTDETAMAVERLRLEVRSWRIEQKTLSSQKAFAPVLYHK